MFNSNSKIRKALSVIAGIAVGVIFALPYILFREKMQSMSTIGYIGLFLSCFISNLSILLPTSSTIIIVAAASTLNPWLCIIFGGLGTAFGEQASYLCGLVGSSGFDKTDSTGKKYALRWFEKKPFLTVFLFAFVPLPVFDIVGIIAGTKKMKWWKYTLAAILGKTLKFFLVIVAVYYFFPFVIDKIPGEFGQLINNYLDQYLTNIK